MKKETPQAGKRTVSGTKNRIFLDQVDLEVTSSMELLWSFHMEFSDQGVYCNQPSRYGPTKRTGAAAMGA